MNQTPYEKRLRSIAVEASIVGDFTTVELAAKMITLIKAAHYEPLQVHFSQLRPSYRARAGAPPASREADCASEPGPGTLH
jgi:hypothetical protein